MDNEKAKLVRHLSQQKNSKICLSLDVPEWDKFFSILEKVGDKIVILKLHLDIMENLNYDNLKQLFDMKKKFNFLIWEDRKLCDIWHTNLLVVKKILSYQFYDEFNKNTKQTDYNSEKLIDFISILPIGGELSITSLFEMDIGIFLLSQMSSKDNFFNDIITNNIISLSNTFYQTGKITGIINQTLNPHTIKYPMLSIMPGINHLSTKDTMEQQYPDITKLKKLPDIFVVGRAIYQSENPVESINDLINKIKLSE